MKFNFIFEEPYIEASEEETAENERLLKLIKEKESQLANDCLIELKNESSEKIENTKINQNKDNKLEKISSRTEYIGENLELLSQKFEKILKLEDDKTEPKNDTFSKESSVKTILLNEKSEFKAEMESMNQKFENTEKKMDLLNQKFESQINAILKSLSVLNENISKNFESIQTDKHKSIESSTNERNQMNYTASQVISTNINTNITITHSYVPDDKVSWSVKWDDYKPNEFTSKDVLDNQNADVNLLTM